MCLRFSQYVTLTLCGLYSTSNRPKIPSSVKWSDMQNEERRRSWLCTWKFLIYLYINTFVWLQTYYFVLTHRSAHKDEWLQAGTHAKNTPQGHSFLLCEWYIKEWLSLQMKPIKRGECDIICIPNLRSMEHTLLQISYNMVQVLAEVWTLKEASCVHIPDASPPYVVYEDHLGRLQLLLERRI